MGLRRALLAAGVPLFLLAALCDSGLGADSRAPSKPKSLEADGKTFPLGLQLTIPRQEVPRGGRLHFRLTLRNLGKKPVQVQDVVFKDPKWFAENRSSKRNTFLVITGPDGEDAYFQRDLMPPGHCNYDFDLATVPVRPKVKEPPRDPLDEFLDRVKGDPALSMRELKAGEAMNTPAWAMPRWVDCVESPQTSADGFTELWNVPFDKPGRYRVRAIYDESVPEAMRKKFPLFFEKHERFLKESSRDWENGEVKVETPWLDIVVR